MTKISEGKQKKKKNKYTNTETKTISGSSITPAVTVAVLSKHVNQPKISSSGSNTSRMTCSHHPPSQSINIDPAFEQACASPQVEPNYFETAPEDCAAG